MYWAPAAIVLIAVRAIEGLSFFGSQVKQVRLPGHWALAHGYVSLVRVPTRRGVGPRVTNPTD